MAERREPEAETGAGDTHSHGSPWISREGTELAGDAAKVSLDEVLTTIFCARSTGTLTLEAHGTEPRVELVFWKGDPVACQGGKLEGDLAVLALLARSGGEFRFSEDLEPREQNVKRSIPELVAEAKSRRRGH